jgi:hypothetical protein
MIEMGKWEEKKSNPAGLGFQATQCGNDGIIITYTSADFQ